MFHIGQWTTHRLQTPAPPEDVLAPGAFDGRLNIRTCDVIEVWCNIDQIAIRRTGAFRAVDGREPVMLRLAVTGVTEEAPGKPCRISVSEIGSRISGRASAGGETAGTQTIGAEADKANTGEARTAVHRGFGRWAVTDASGAEIAAGLTKEQARALADMNPQ